MTKPLNVLADELESEIDKIHKMNIDIPEEFLIKEHWCSRIMGDPEGYFKSKYDGGGILRDWTQK